MATQIEELEAEVERIRQRRKNGLDREKVRTILNYAFILLAAVGLVLYFFVFKEGERTVPLVVIGAGMLLKIIEFVLRYTA